MLNIKSVQALIQLIDDPDDLVYSHVHDQLKSYGPEAIPYLESSWESTDFGLLFQNRIENLIHEIQFSHIKDLLLNWIQSENKDLLEGAIIIARYQYPGLEVEKIHQQIELIRKDIWLELNPNQTSYEKIKTFNKIFYEKYHFQGNSKNFHSPLNSYINTVLETKYGNPLSLSLLYSVIAQRLQIPVYGVNLPNHFVLAYMDEHSVNHILGNKNLYGVLFYINTFSKGMIFQENDIHLFLKQIKTKATRSYFEPCPNTQIISRMLLNLIAAFQAVGNVDKVNELKELHQLFKPSNE
jgi:regulator of sirC expression with transglutaminase-like and TPR domain